MKATQRSASVPHAPRPSGERRGVSPSVGRGEGTFRRWFRTARQLRVVDLALRPTVQRLEDRSYPGQAPGVLGWALAGTGLAFLDQSLLTFPLDGGDRTRPTVVAWHPESATSPAALLPADDAGPSAAQATAWIVALNSGESQPTGSESAAEPSASQRDTTSVPAGSWQSDLLPDSLEGPLAKGGLDDLGETPTPHHPLSLPSSSPSAAASLDFSLPSGPGAVGSMPDQTGGWDHFSPISPGISEAELTALAATLPAGTSGKLPSSQVTPDAAMLQTLAANGITWNGSGGDSGTPPPQDNLDTSATQSRAQSFAKTPLRFEANRGQLDAHAQFVGRANGYNLFLTATEMVLALDRPGSASGSTGQGRGNPPPLPDQYVIRMQMVGANPNSQLTGLNQLPGVRRYLQGTDRTHWITNVPSFSQVAYRNLYPGIDMLFYGNDKGQLEYDFSVAPGANPAALQLAFTGTQGVALDAHGNLVLHTPFGDLTEHAPIVYQVVHGVRQPVTGQYVVPDAGHVGFQVGTYNHSLPLIIDPYFSYSEYLGGDGADDADAITVDSAGNAYVSGSTDSVNFPFGIGVISGSNRGNGDAFVAKLDPSGNLVYFSIFGGGQYDVGTSIATRTTADGTVYPYVTGNTSSTDFPIVSGYQMNSPGGTHGFVAELQPDGMSFVYSTYLRGMRGNGTDMPFGLAVDNAGSAYVTGSTTSTDFPVFPPMTAFQSNLGGGTDAFVTKLTPDGTGLVYSTYFGGQQDDSGQGIAVDASGNAYIAGSTTSNPASGDQWIVNAIQPINRSGPVLKSTDGGTSWIPANIGLPHDVTSLVVYPTGNSNTPIGLYVLTMANSVYNSPDGGTTWNLVRSRA